MPDWLGGPRVARRRHERARCVSALGCSTAARCATDGVIGLSWSDQFGGPHSTYDVDSDQAVQGIVAAADHVVRHEHAQSVSAKNLVGVGNPRTDEVRADEACCPATSRTQCWRSSVCWSGCRRPSGTRRSVSERQRCTRWFSLTRLTKPLNDSLHGARTTFGRSNWGVSSATATQAPLAHTAWLRLRRRTRHITICRITGRRPASHSGTAQFVHPITPTVRRRRTSPEPCRCGCAWSGTVTARPSPAVPDRAVVRLQQEGLVADSRVWAARLST